MEQLVVITEKAISHISKIFQEQENPGELGLRLGVIGGGCSGLSYKIDFGDQKENDLATKRVCNACEVSFALQFSRLILKCSFFAGEQKLKYDKSYYTLHGDIN